MTLTIKNSDISFDNDTAASTNSSRTNVWEWDTCEFTLVNPAGEKVVLNSLHINDFTLGHIREDLEKYVEETHGGVLE
jgi:hypothetical protein